MDLKGRDLASKVGVFWSTCCRLQELWPRIFGEDLTLALQPVPPSSEAFDGPRAALQKAQVKV